MRKKKSTLEERLVKGYIKQKKEERKEYAISEIKALSRDDLFEIKCQYRAALKTTIPWTWIIALYGAVLAFLSGIVNEESGTNIELILLTIAVVGAGIIAIRLNYVMLVQRYLLYRVEERLDVLKEEENCKEKKGFSVGKEAYREIIDMIRKRGEKERIEIKERIVKKMLEDGVLSERKIAEYAEMTVEQIRKNNK